MFEKYSSSQNVVGFILVSCTFLIADFLSCYSLKQTNMYFVSLKLCIFLKLMICYWIMTSHAQIIFLHLIHYVSIFFWVDTRIWQLKLVLSVTNQHNHFKLYIKRILKFREYIFVIQFLNIFFISPRALIDILTKLSHKCKYSFFKYYNYHVLSSKKGNSSLSN